MDTILIILWYAIGMCGCFIGWLSEMCVNAYLGRKYGQRPSEVEWCPTPRAIFFGLILSGLGPLAVVVGCIMCAVVWLEYLSTTGPLRKWFTKPICK